MELHTSTVLWRHAEHAWYRGSVHWVGVCAYRLCRSFVHDIVMRSPARGGNTMGLTLVRLLPLFL